MGTYYSTHVGCFIRVPVTSKPVTKSYYKKPSGKRAKVRFNPETGVEHELCTEIVNEKVYPSAYITDRDDLDEDMFYHIEVSKKEVIFIPNEREDNLAKTDTQWDYTLSLLHVDPEDEILKFKRKYSKYLDYYREKFGHFEMDFGIVREGR